MFMCPSAAYYIKSNLNFDSTRWFRVDLHVQEHFASEKS